MEHIFTMTVAQACEKSRASGGRSALADELWAYKHPGSAPDRADSEYRSWLRSTPLFLAAAARAGLGDLDAAFEVSPGSDEYIDVVLIGESRAPADPDEAGRLLIVELKQWSDDRVTFTADPEYLRVRFQDGEQVVPHVLAQLQTYRQHLCEHHRGIYKNGHIAVDAVAYLHNFKDRNALYGPGGALRQKWPEFDGKVFVQGEEGWLSAYLGATFSPQPNRALCDILDDNSYVLGEAGFAGLTAVLAGRENAEMVADQMPVIDGIRRHLEEQKSSPHREILLVTGGPGTGKTIVGIHAIYDYAQIFGKPNGAEGAVFCLFSSKMVKTVIDRECGRARGTAGAAIYLYNGREGRVNIGTDQDLVVVDEAHRMTEPERVLDLTFARGTKLLLLFQDDYQIIAPNENGTLANFENYAERHGIPFHTLALTVQKRCAAFGNFVSGLEQLFYKDVVCRNGRIGCVHVFDRFGEMDRWIREKAKTARAKYIAPFCWPWENGKAIRIDDGGSTWKLEWNPRSDRELTAWYYSDRVDQAGCMFTCQGLDFDYVALIWWNDLRWDEAGQKWAVDIGNYAEKDMCAAVRRGELTPEKLVTLFLDLYYVLLTRARKEMGIWFKDEATKNHVCRMLGLRPCSAADAVPSAPAAPAPPAAAPARPDPAQQAAAPEPGGAQKLRGTVTYADPAKGYAYLRGEDGETYRAAGKTFAAAAALLQKGARVRFSVWTLASGKKYAQGIERET